MDTPTETADTRTADVVVIDASLAGCTAAVLLARAGLHVALVEKHRHMDAHKPLCTHFVRAPPRRSGGSDWPSASRRLAGIRADADLWTRCVDSEVGLHAGELS